MAKYGVAGDLLLNMDGLEPIRRIVERREDVRLAYLFGSAARSS